jgi:hypothetical protein
MGLINYKYFNTIYVIYSVLSSEKIGETFH